MPKFIFNKLVRDKLRDEYVKIGQIAEYRELSKGEFSRALTAKMIEEINEIPAEGKDEIVAELADLHQAIDDLMELHGIEVEDVKVAQKKKHAKRGGFSAHNFVVSLELKDDDEWVKYYREKPDVFTEVVDAVKHASLPLIEDGTYKHYKGKRYEVIGVGLDSETLKPVVVYVPLYKSDTPFWVRPYDMFLEFVEHEGKKVRRFHKED